MEHIFPIVIASLLLLLILLAFRVRIGLSYLGVGAAVALSFLCILLIFVAQAILPLWQSILVIVLLALCMSYLLQKKLESRLFTRKEKVDPFTNMNEELLFEKFTEKYDDKRTDNLDKLFQPGSEELSESSQQKELDDWEKLFQHEHEGGNVR